MLTFCRCSPLGVLLYAVAMTYYFNLSKDYFHPSKLPLQEYIWNICDIIMFIFKSKCSYRGYYYYCNVWNNICLKISSKDESNNWGNRTWTDRINFSFIHSFRYRFSRSFFYVSSVSNLSEFVCNSMHGTGWFSEGLLFGVIVPEVIVLSPF